MAEASSSGGKGVLVAVCIIGGLLLGAGVVTPFALKYRASMQKAEEDARAQARQAEEAHQQAIALEKAKAEMRENLGAAEKQISTLKTDLDTRSAALSQLKQSDEAKAKEVEALRTDVQKMDENLKSAKAELDSSTKENSTLQGRVNEMRSQISRLAETVQVKGEEIAKLVVEKQKEEQAKQEAIRQVEETKKLAEETQKKADAAAAQAAAAEAEIMTRAPLRIEERRASKTGRQLGDKSKVPFAGVLDPVGDLFTGIGEGLFGRKGPIIWVAVYKDKRQEVISREDAEKWGSRGIQVVRLNEKKK